MVANVVARIELQIFDFGDDIAVGEIGVMDERSSVICQLCRADRRSAHP